MSNTNINYYINIDSEYRDRNQYPQPTDFAVSFKTRDKTLQYPKGLPVDPTQMFPRVTIDKNYNNSKLYIPNANINNYIFDSVGYSTIYCGYTNLSATNSNFQIVYDDDILFTSFLNLSIPLSDSNQYSLPFLFSIAEDHTLNWVIYAIPANPTKQTYQGVNNSRNAIVNLLLNSFQIMFDYQSNLNFYRVGFSPTTNQQLDPVLLYSAINPYGNGLTSYSIIVLGLDGNYPITNSNEDATPLSTVYYGIHNFYTRASEDGSSAPYNIANFNFNYASFNFNMRGFVSQCTTDLFTNAYNLIGPDTERPIITNCLLNNPIGDPETLNTPISYPNNLYIAAWKPLIYTTSVNDITGIYTSSGLHYYAKSQTLIICNTTTDDSSYTGTSIISPMLYQHELPVYDGTGAQGLQWYDRTFLYATGTYSSGATTNINNVFKTYIDQITTADFVLDTPTLTNNGRIICDNIPFGSNIASITTFYFTLNSPNCGNLDLTQESTYIFPVPISGILSIKTISAIDVGGNQYYIYVIWSDSLTTTLEIFTYDTITFVYSSIATFTPIYDILYGDVYYDDINSLYVFWATDEKDTTPITFYKINGGTLSSIGSISTTDIGVGPRSGMRSYTLLNPSSTFYFTLSVNGTQKTFVLSITASVLTYTLQLQIDNATTNSYTWLDNSTYRQYLISSNPDASSINIYNNYTGNKKLDFNFTTAGNNAYYITNDTVSNGDVYIISASSNTLYASWGSVLQNPQITSGHKYLPSILTVPLTKRIIRTMTVWNDDLTQQYAIYIYDDPITEPVYFYIYNITDTLNTYYVGTVSTDIPILPSIQTSAIYSNNYIYITCNSTNVLVIRFNIYNVANYDVINVDTSGITQKYSQLASYLNVIYLFEQFSSIDGFTSSKYEYNELTNTFDLIDSTNYPQGGSTTIFGVGLFTNFERPNRKIENVVFGTDGTLNSPYTIYIIDFDNILTNTIPTIYASVDTPFLFRVVSSPYVAYVLFNFANVQMYMTSFYINVLNNPGTLDYLFAESNILLPYTDTIPNYTFYISRYILVENLTTIDCYEIITPGFQYDTSFLYQSNLSINRIYLNNDNIAYTKLTSLSSIPKTIYNSNELRYITTSNFKTILTADNDNINDPQYITKIYDKNVLIYNALYPIDPYEFQNFTTIYGQSSSSIIAINNIGSYIWGNSIGGSYPNTGLFNQPDPSANIVTSINSFGNNVLYLNGYVYFLLEIDAGQMSIVNPSETFDTNYISTSSTTIVVGKMIAVNGKMEWIMAANCLSFLFLSCLTSVGNNLVIGTAVDNTILSIYEPQISRSSTGTSIPNPYIQQQAIALDPLTSYQPILFSIDKEAQYLWNVYYGSVQGDSTTQEGWVAGCIGTDGLLVVVGHERGNTTIYDSNKNIQSILYTPNAESGDFLFRSVINASGTLINSDIFAVGGIGNAYGYDYFVPQLGIYNPVLNEVIYPQGILVNNNPSATNMFGKVKQYNGDMSLADYLGKPTNNTRFEQYIYTGPGIYDLTVPTGCIGTVIKLWGAGGSCPSDSLANNWIAYGGGGGFAQSHKILTPNTNIKIKVGSAGQGSQFIFTGTLQYTGGIGGECSSCHYYENGFWNVLALAGGGGGAGAGCTGTLNISSEGYGGSAGYNGNIGFTNLPITFTKYGLSGKYGVGGKGGDLAGTNLSQNGQNYIVNSSGTYSSSLGTGGTSSFNNYMSPYTYLYGGGAGGQGFGGGGAGDPGIDPLVGDQIQSCGGGGGYSYGETVYRLESEPSWYPANYVDMDYDILSPNSMNEVFSYGQGGKPILDYLGNYNPTGTDGLAVVYFYFPTYGYEDATGAPYTMVSFMTIYNTDYKFIDTNFKEYAKLTIYKNQPSDAITTYDTAFLPYETGTERGSLSNAYIYIMGSGTTLNQNFLIRDNYYDPLTNEYTIILQQTIDVNKLTRRFWQINNDYNSQFFYNSDICKTALTSIVSYTPINSTTIKLDYISSPVSNANSYYVIQYTSTGSENIIQISNVYQDKYFNTYISLTGGSLEGSGSYILVSGYNKSALYNLQFTPASIYTSVTYTAQLTSLCIPNRAISPSNIPGIRYLNDYPYIFLQLFNCKDDGLPDPTVINTIFTNNPNGPPNGVEGPIFPDDSIFQINMDGAIGGDNNFSYFSSSVVPRVKFNPGWYNIRFRLLDPYGNVITFDNSPTKPSDSVFGSGIVAESLIRLTANIVLTKI
jgi:hypothetical protein